MKSRDNPRHTEVQGRRTGDKVKQVVRVARAVDVEEGMHQL